MKTKNQTLDTLGIPFGKGTAHGMKKPIQSHPEMKLELVNIDNREIPNGLEWFVFEKRSQRARKQRFRPNEAENG